MKLPSITFNEANVGVTPVQQGVRNRIGIVGEFSRGPANSPSFISGFTDFANRYGSDLNRGSLALQAAFDQGAEEFEVLRVLGRDKVAKGTVRFSGIASKQNTLLLNLKFIGEAVDIGVLPLTELITTFGKYSSSQSGRYYFQVSAVASGSATVKYTFLALGADATAINWGTVTDTFAVNLTSDKGVAKLVSNGLYLTFGSSGQTNLLSLKVGDTWTVRANSDVIQIPINQGDLPNQIVTSILSVASGYLPLGEISRTAEDDGVVFSLSPDLAGDIGNNYSYYVELADVTAPGITTTVSSPANSLFMQGGVDGPVNAYVDFYSISNQLVLRLIAVSEGAWGNQLRITLYPTSNSSFRVQVEDLSANNFNPVLGSESFIVSFANTDSNGFLTDLSTSKFLRGIFVPKFLDPATFDINLINQSPQRLAPSDANITDVANPAHTTYYGPSKLISVPFAFGSDGPLLTEADYVNALKIMEAEPVHIVLCAGMYDSPAIKAALITHAENSQELEGLRVAILNAPPNLTPDTAKQVTLGFESKRAVMVAGWSSYAGQPNAPRYGLAPDGVYAGKLAATPYFAGPNAPRSAGRVFNVTEVDTSTYSSTSALQILTDARLEILAINPALQNFNFVNGRTLSSDPAWEKISIRRTYDFIRQDLFVLLQQYKGEPNTGLLRSQISSAINAYMQDKLRASEIANFTSAICDSSNNTADDYINGRLNVSISFLPLYAADYIEITLIRDTGSGLVSFGT